MTRAKDMAPQKAIRAPLCVLVLIVIFLVLQGLLSFSDRNFATMLLVSFGLFPARFFAEGLGGLPGGIMQGLFNLLSYGFLHGGWSHCLVNSVWLLAFASPVAQRMGTRRFLLLYMLCVAFAGFGQVLVSSPAAYLVPVIGASGGVSGMMGAAARFAFSDTSWLNPQAAMQRRRLLPLRAVPRRRPVIVFVLVWLGLNLIFGLLGPLGLLVGMASPDDAPVNIAWVAHLVGFFTGLLLIGVIDKPPLSASGGPGNVDYGEWKKPF